MNKILKVIIVLAVLYTLSNLIAGSIIVVDFRDKIAVIPITGVITSTGSSGVLEKQGASSDKIVSYLEKADKDKTVKGIILEINSPGGTVVASEEISRAVKKVKKPVVAWIREVGASGAYWIASSAGTIVADPMSITGSIGVLGSYLEFTGLMEKYGVNYERLVAGEYKDTGSSYKKLTEKEKELLQKKLNTIHDFFIKEISKNRKIDIKLADGMFYLGIEAKELGLVDYLGGKELAVNITKERANITEVELIVYKEKRTIFDLLSNFFSKSSYHIGKGIGSELYNSVKDDQFQISV